MKRLFAIVLLTAVLVSCTAFGEEEVYFIICKPKSSVNARYKPNSASEVVGWYDCGDMVKSDGKEKNGYIHIVDCSLEVSEAWISKRYLVDEKPTVHEMTVMVIGDGRVQARAWVNGRRNCWLKPGKIVTVYAWTDEWAVTNKGYIQTAFLGVN